ncbi:MAG TPA: ABC transporter transmembrane domain-containing protein [Stellaceae bacterium]|nr:ABC transporter transmembrane domain-containing protein [Stellaceae bacterium]
MSETPSATHNAALFSEQRRRLLARLAGLAIRPHWRVMIGVLACMALVAGLTGAIAWLLQPVIDDVFVARNRAMLVPVAVAVVAVFLTRSLASYGQDAMLAWVGQRVLADLQSLLFRHMLGQDVALLQSRHSGTLVSHFTYDVNLMRSAVSNALVGIGRDSLSVVCLAAVMFGQDWRLTLVTLAVAPFTTWPIQRLAKRLRRVSGGIQDEMGRLNTTLSQSFQGIRVIKSFAMEDHEARRAEAVIDRLFRLNVKSAQMGAAVQPIIDAFGGLAVAAVIVYGGMRVIEGATTAGAFFSFFAAVGLAYQPLRSIGKVVPGLQDGLAAAERIFALLDRKPAIADRADAGVLPRVAGEVRFERVSFAYDEETEALSGLDFTAPSGRVTALVGPSGAGKSTVFNLIPRFYEAGSGRVLVNGSDVRDVTLASLRDALAIVGQDVMLFDDTILANIRHGRPEADDAAVVAAARAAAADEFIRALPEGYQTMVGERGVRLSGGQRQRIAIARALLKDAPILLLDEATSALDTESERQIQAALKRLMNGRTTLVIAHRLSTIRDADAIHVFDAGRVIESGSHDDLVRAEGGLYARLHALQFAGDVVDA